MPLTSSKGRGAHPDGGGWRLVRLDTGKEAADDPRRLTLHLVGNADRCGLAHGRMADRSRLELGRADALARDVQGVVGAAMQEPQSCFSLRS